MTTKGYKDLEVWRKSISNVKEIYLLTKKFPKEEAFGLTSQIRRSAVSIAANIAEGSGRKSQQEFIRFLNIAYGSLCELETHIIIAYEIEIINKKELDRFLKNLEIIAKMLSGLKNSLANNSKHKTNNHQ